MNRKKNKALLNRWPGPHARYIFRNLGADSAFMSPYAFISPDLPGKFSLLSFLFLLCMFQVRSQDMTQARQLADAKKYKEAAALYKELCSQEKSDPACYKEYLDVLINGRYHKEAAQLVHTQQSRRPNDPLLMIDMGRVYLASGKTAKAEEQFENAVAAITGDDILTTTVAGAFISYHLDAYAIKTYERAIEILRNPIFYGMPLARLYARNKAVDKAVDLLLSSGNIQRPGVEDINAQLLEILDDDPEKLKTAQKTLLKKIQEQPSNSWYTELLTWLYTQKGDWDGALIQIRAVDHRNREDGKKLMAFARTAALAGQYQTAYAALDDILELGADKPLYGTARAEKLTYSMNLLDENPFFTTEEVSSLERDFESFFRDFPAFWRSPSIQQYARLKARYADKPEEAVSILETGLKEYGSTKEHNGKLKLQLGDYYLLTGRIWDASLLYSQVDKDFREDLLGEEARFRNAKLAYYRGDFEWAQGQLTVLKASTSELIANDALQLSVLITENIPPDSNLIPLQRFADADLLLYRNKLKEAESILDSLNQFFPDHPLTDDIFLLRASIAKHQRDYPKALGHLQKILEKHATDVLGDDARFQTAELYEKYLKQPAEAKKHYEQLILDYPGSSFTQAARDKLKALSGENL